LRSKDVVPDVFSRHAGAYRDHLSRAMERGEARGRTRLLELLREGELSVQELVERTGATQQNVSKHLGVLLHAGIVGRRKQGVCVYYRIADATVFDICELVCGSLEQQFNALGMELQEAVS